MDDTEEEALVAVEVDGVAQLQLQVHLPAARLLQDAAGAWGSSKVEKNEMNGIFHSIIFIILFFYFEDLPE